MARRSTSYKPATLLKVQRIIASFIIILRLCFIANVSASLDVAHFSPTPMVPRGVLVSDVFVSTNGTVHISSQDDIPGVSETPPVTIHAIPKHGFGASHDVIQTGKTIAICGAYKWGANWYVVGGGARGISLSSHRSSPPPQVPQPV